MRCTDFNHNVSLCCNYFQEGKCVTECSDGLVPNNDFDCRKSSFICVCVCVCVCGCMLGGREYSTETNKTNSLLSHS